MARGWRVAAVLAVVAGIAAIVVLGLNDRPERLEPESGPSSTGAAAAPASLSGSGDPKRILKDLDPSRFPAVLERARPRPVMIDFWASWCEPCRLEMPFITKLRAKYVGRIDFVGVNYQDGREPAAEFVREFQVNFPSYRDQDGKIGQGQGGIIGMPTAIFLDGDGREIHRQTGAFPTEAAMEEILKRLL